MKTAVLFASALIPALALAQAASTPAADSAAASSHAMVKAADIKWGPPPDSLPKGAEFTVMSGDPGKAGPFTVRIKAPAGYKVPRHWHPSMEAVTILEGDFHLSMGDAANAHDADFASGDFVVLPEQMQHEASTKGGVIVQVSSMGPFVVNYVDPKDDPRKATASK